MTTKNYKRLCLALIKSDTEKEVIDHLQSEGYWDRTEIWRWLGDEEFNYSTVGNQQSQPEQAIVEKLVNSIDAKLICQARIEGHLPLEGSTPQKKETPKSIEEARKTYFGKGLSNGENISKSITVTATAKGIPSQGIDRPCFSIADNGEGQIPRRVPETILSLQKGNKDKIKFAQGKFNMGGTGVLEFCGLDHNIQLVVSKRHPDLIPKSSIDRSDNNWSFTIIRREDPAEGKSSRFVYLAPLESESNPNNGKLLHFSSQTLPIFPEGNKPYARESAWGTLIKLFEYDARRIKRPIMLKGGLMPPVRLMLPEPALPIRFYECRPFNIKKGSNDVLMQGLIKTLKNNYKGETQKNVEWYDKLQFVINEEEFSAELFLFKDKNSADQYKGNEGLLFTYNGQCHATIPKDFFRRKKVGLDYLWHSLVMLVDCSNVKPRTHEQLFMNSRDRLREGELKTSLESGIEEELSQHSELKMKASERRKRELSQNSNASESMAKVIEKLLSRNPTLANILQQGTRIKNPHKPESVDAYESSFVGKRFPTRFHFKGKDPSTTYRRDAFIGSTIRLEFETDAENDYFRRDEEPGELTIFGDTQLTNYQKIPRLMDGMANLSLKLPDNVVKGEKLDFVVEITDPSRPEPFNCRLQLNVKPPRKNQPGGNSSGGDRNTSFTDGYLDIPEPQEVYAKDWSTHDPDFDRQTAIRIKDHPETKFGEERYDFFVNMDNVYLQTYLKAKPKEANNLKLKFTISMTLIALSVLHQDQLMKKHISPDMPSKESDVRDRVAATTSAIAPFLLPMIDSVSVLEAEDYIGSGLD